MLQRIASLDVPGRLSSYNDKYVIVYDFKDVDHDTAEEELNELVEDLELAGFHTELRAGYERTLLIFIKVPRDILGNAVYKSRVKDWLYGITPKQPVGDKSTVVSGAFEAEDILSTYHLVKWSKSNGGAGITPQWGKWENVQSMFPLHNEVANHTLLRRLSKRLVLTAEDLDSIRDLYGSKVAFYFAFIQTYLMFLLFPAATGTIAWLFFSRYSLVYAIITCVWCTVFLEYWKIQEIDLSIRWGVRGVAQVKGDRPQFRWVKEIVDDTGRTQRYFPRWNLALRQLLQIPFVALATIALGIIIIGVFALEILISEGYNGAYKTILGFIPTIMLALALPRISVGLETVAVMITDFENHRTDDNYEMALTQKKFMLSIITNYLPILITAFIYVPFGDDIVPWLSGQSRRLLGPLGGKYLYASESFQVDSARLRDEVIALALTGQVSSFFEENVVPVLKRKFQGWYRDYKASRSKDTVLLSIVDDDPSEAAFLKTARDQATREEYNVQDDIAEIVLQFGYLALFSPVWPLISIGFLVNNIIEIRTDFIKIATEHQRPAPVRADGIGPWINSLDFLTWAGSISAGAVVHLFGTDSIAGGAWWALPITIFISEHVFTALRSIVRTVLHRIGSEQIRKERNERYAMRVKYLEDIEAHRKTKSSLTVEERIHRKSVRVLDMDTFFTKQIEQGSSAAFGVKLIHACANAQGDDEHNKKD